MDKLLTNKTNPDSGHPLRLNDLRWLQNAYTDALKGIMSAYGLDPDESFILSGCEVTDAGTQWNIAAGWISLNGEIFKVDAHSVDKAVSGETNFWTEDITYPAEDPVIYSDGTQNNVHEVRKAKVDVSDTPPSPFMPIDAITLEEKIKGFLLNQINHFTRLQQWNNEGALSVVNVGGENVVQLKGNGNFFEVDNNGKSTLKKIVSDGTFTFSGSAKILMKFDNDIKLTHTGNADGIATPDSQDVDVVAGDIAEFVRLGDVWFLGNLWSDSYRIIKDIRDSWQFWQGTIESVTGGGILSQTLVNYTKYKIIGKTMIVSFGLKFDGDFNQASIDIHVPGGVTIASLVLGRFLLQHDSGTSTIDDVHVQVDLATNWIRLRKSDGSDFGTLNHTALGHVTFEIQ